MKPVEALKKEVGLLKMEIHYHNVFGHMCAPEHSLQVAKMKAGDYDNSLWYEPTITVVHMAAKELARELSKQGFPCN